MSDQRISDNLLLRREKVSLSFSTLLGNKTEELYNLLVEYVLTVAQEESEKRVLKTGEANPLNETELQGVIQFARFIRQL